MDDVFSILWGLAIAIFLGLALCRSIFGAPKAANGLPLASPERTEEAFEIYESTLRAEHGSKFDMDLRMIVNRADEGAIAQCKMGQALIFECESAGHVRVIRDRDRLFLGYLETATANMIAAESSRGRMWGAFFEGRPGNVGSIYIFALRFSAAFAQISREMVAGEPLPNAAYEALSKSSGVGHA